MSKPRTKRRFFTMKKTILRSQELSCPSCVAKIEAALKTLDGVSDAKVYFNTGKIEVQHDPEQVKPSELVKAVKAVGYEAREAAI
jgi:copper chaperone CopZ